MLGNVVAAAGLIALLSLRKGGTGHGMISRERDSAKVLLEIGRIRCADTMSFDFDARPAAGNLIKQILERLTSERAGWAATSATAIDTRAESFIVIVRG